MKRIPDIISNYFHRAVPSPLEKPMGIILKQEGQMRLGPERNWMPFTATQTVEATHIEFCWQAKFKMAPLLTGTVVDAFENKEGRLDAKIWGLIPVAHGKGPDVDRGEIQRYLAELVWCPTAFLHNSELNYHQLSDNVIRVWAFDEETYVDLQFDATGDIIGIETDTRVREDTPQTWRGKFSDFKTFGGVRIPARGEVWWETPEGPFVYWKGSITSIEWQL